MVNWRGTEKPRHQTGLSIDYLTLRKVVGCIGLLLPVGLLAGNSLVTSSLPDSMSAYYYTDVRNLFVGALCALGVFLVSYAGFDDWDRWLTNVAGGGAIMVAFLPTKPTVCADHARTCLAPAVRALSAEQSWVGNFHLAFAAITFVALGCMALRFAKTEPQAYQPATSDSMRTVPGVLKRAWDGLGLEKPKPQNDHRTPEKKKRNIVYRTCGVTILACIVLAAASNLLPQPIQSDLPWFFIFEALAVIAFGISWLVKGETLLRDRPAGTAADQGLLVAVSAKP
ncbi:MAG TPA: hypothetical protein VEL03_13900 [Streptosporangiaceae bacterium]|nr:hypothetical protein [Streptosporangiaceae bacterium]